MLTGADSGLPARYKKKKERPANGALLTEVTMMLEMYGDVLTIDDVAEILNIKRYKVYQLIRDRTIPVLNIGRPYRIPKIYVLNLLKGIENDRTI